MLKLTDIDKTISSKFQKQFILKGINLEIEEGEFVTIMGPSGAGKSTLLKTIQGLIKPHDGKMYCNVQTAYLDQNLSFLAAEISATEYLKTINNCY